MLAVAAAVIRTTAFQNGPSIGWMRLYGAPRETMQDLLEDNSMLFGSLAPVFTRGGMGIFSRSIIVSIRPVEGGCYVASVCPMDSQLRLWAGLLVLNLCCAVLCCAGLAWRSASCTCAYLFRAVSCQHCPYRKEGRCTRIPIAAAAAADRCGY